MKLKITTLGFFFLGTTLLFAQEPESASLKKIKTDKPTTEVEISEARKIELAKHKKETAEKKSNTEAKKAKMERKKADSNLQLKKTDALHLKAQEQVKTKDDVSDKKSENKIQEEQVKKIEN